MLQVCKEKREDRQTSAGRMALVVVSQLLRLDLRNRRVDPEKFCVTQQTQRVKASISRI